MQANSGEGPEERNRQLSRLQQDRAKKEHLPPDSNQAQQCGLPGLTKAENAQRSISSGSI
jgi:hypothetical protein